MRGRLKDSIEKAAALRSDFVGEGTNAYRLFDGEGDGDDDLFIDVFAGHWLVQTRGMELPEDLREGGFEGCRSIWWKRLEQEGRAAPERVCGEDPGRSFEVLENRIRYLVDFEAGYSQGIFLDQRLNRRRILKEASRETEILNCFAYTCGFSAAAATAGAMTTSVDLSRPYLDWGRRNFALNDLDARGHEFLQGDVADWLGRFAKRGRVFGGVVLDPPTFSRNREGKVFRAERDYGSLVAGAARVVADGGWLLCCSNCRTLREGGFEKMLREGLESAGRRDHSLQAIRMPPEYRGEKYLKSYWIRVAS